MGRLILRRYSFGFRSFFRTCHSTLALLRPSAAGQSASKSLPKPTFPLFMSIRTIPSRVESLFSRPIHIGAAQGAHPFSYTHHPVTHITTLHIFTSSRLACRACPQRRLLYVPYLALRPLASIETQHELPASSQISCYGKQYKSFSITLGHSLQE